MPSASAASVPGSSARCTWHFSAVRLRYGSMAISFAPRRFACLHAGPQMQVRDDRVGAPDQDQPGMLELLEVGADRGADGRGIARLAGARADRAVEQRRAELVEEAPIHRAVLQQAHGPGVAVGQNRLRAVRRRGDFAVKRAAMFGQRFVPADRARSARSLWDRRGAAAAAGGRANTFARGSARPWCTACRRCVG